MPAVHRALIAKIEALPADRLAEIEDFVDFIRLRDQDRAPDPRRRRPASTASFAAVWNNPEDDDYDAL